MPIDLHGLIIPVALLACAAIARAQASTNTLLLIADDVGIDGIGVYAAVANPPPTPNLDQLARGGVLFRNALANPVCSPTRACMFTGRYAFRTGIGQVVGNGAQGLQLSEQTLPEVLNANGTRHALIGKWHLGDAIGADAPNQHGFGHFTGTLGPQVSNYFSWQKTTNGTTTTSTAYATTDLVNEALAWIGTQTGSWVCVVAFQAAHTPLHAPPAALHSQDLTGLNPGTTPLPFFKAMVEAMDTEIGRLLTSLPPTVLANTNVVFMGDNGSPRNVTQAPFDPLHAKGTLYEGGTHVPLMVSGPIVVAPGREVAALVDPTDYFATVCELQGIDARAQVPTSVSLDSVSFAPYLRSATQLPLRTVAHVELFPGVGAGHAVRDARWKLIRFSGMNARDELFDLAADPQEQVNLYDGSLTPEQQAAYEDLRLAAARLRGEALALSFGSACPGAAGVPALAAPNGGPRTGSALSLRLSALAPTATGAVLLLGASRTHLGALLLPIDLSALGMHGCLLQVSGEVALAMPAPVQGVSVTSLTVPANPGLVGATFFTQGLVVEPAANAAGLIVTASLAMVVGSP